MPEVKLDRNKVKQNVGKTTREASNSRNNRHSSIRGHRRRSKSSSSDSSSSSTRSSSSSSSSTSSSSNSSSSSASSSSSRSALPSPHKRVNNERKTSKTGDLRNKDIKENQNTRYKERNQERKQERKQISNERNKENDRLKSRKEIPDSRKAEIDNVKVIDKKVEKGQDKYKEEKQPTSSKKIHVTKLTRNVTLTHLKEIFSTWGSVKHIDLPTDRFHPEFHLGFAYIEFDEPLSAKQAVNEMHNGQVDGQEISVVEVPVPRVDRELNKVNMSRDRIKNTGRYRSPPRRNRRSPLRRRSPSRRRRSPSYRRRSPRRQNASRSRRRRDSRQKIRQRTKSPTSASRKYGRYRRNRRSRESHYQSSSSSSNC